MIPDKHDCGTVTFEASEAIPVGSLVTLATDGTISVAAITEEAIGTAAEQAYAAPQRIGVDLFSKPGTMVGIAAASFNPGQVLYGQNAGKISTSTAGSALRVGIAKGAAGANNDLVEFIPDKGA